MVDKLTSARIRRVELAVAALAEMLIETNPHICRELHLLAEKVSDEIPDHTKEQE